MRQVNAKEFQIYDSQLRRDCREQTRRFLIWVEEAQKQKPARTRRTKLPTTIAEASINLVGANLSLSTCSDWSLALCLPSSTNHKPPTQVIYRSQFAVSAISASTFLAQIFQSSTESSPPSVVDRPTQSSPCFPSL